MEPHVSDVKTSEDSFSRTFEGSLGLSVRLRITCSYEESIEESQTEVYPFSNRRLA